MICCQCGNAAAVRNGSSGSGSGRGRGRGRGGGGGGGGGVDRDARKTIVILEQSLRDPGV